MDISAVVFDLDNTLVSSAVDFKKMRSRILDYLISRYPHLKKSGGFSTTRDIICWLEKNDHSHLSREDDIAEIHRIMDNTEMEAIGEANPLCEIRDLLTELKEMGLRIGLLTRSCGRYAKEIMDRNKCTEFFDALGFRCMNRPSKPEPKALHLLSQALKIPVQEILMVGDHAMDGQCARMAGAKFVAVSYGSSSNEDLMDLDPLAILDNLEELPLMIQKITKSHVAEDEHISGINI